MELMKNLEFFSYSMDCYCLLVLYFFQPRLLDILDPSAAWHHTKVLFPFSQSRLKAIQQEVWVYTLSQTSHWAFCLLQWFLSRFLLHLELFDGFWECPNTFRWCRRTYNRVNCGVWWGQLGTLSWISWQSSLGRFLFEFLLGYATDVNGFARDQGKNAQTSNTDVTVSVNSIKQK